MPHQQQEISLGTKFPSILLDLTCCLDKLSESILLYSIYNGLSILGTVTTH